MAGRYEPPTKKEECEKVKRGGKTYFCKEAPSFERSFSKLIEGVAGIYKRTPLKSLAVPESLILILEFLPTPSSSCR